MLKHETLPHERSSSPCRSPTKKTAYLRSQPLARLATVSGDGQPDVVPVGFDFDGSYFYVSGYQAIQTRKFQNVMNGNSKVALVVDDLASTQPWAPRFLRIYGTADVVQREGYAGPTSYLRITPRVSWSWNLAGEPFAGETERWGPELHRTIHQLPNLDAQASRRAQR